VQLISALALAMVSYSWWDWKRFFNCKWTQFKTINRIDHKINHVLHISV